MRFAVIGLGQRMSAVLSALKAAGADFEITRYVDPEPVGLERVVREGIKVGEALNSVEQLLTAGKHDLVMIGSPNHLHAEHLMLALYGEAPVFAEKPIVRTENESYALAQRLSNEATPSLYVGLVLRSAPIVREILSIIQEGHLGQIVSIDATEHLPPEHGAYLARNWRRRREWGGSFLLDKVCHDFDILSDIAGARAQRVVSFGGRGIFRHDREPGARSYSDGSPAFEVWPGGWAADADAFSSDMDVTDHQTALVEYLNGVQLSFHANTSTALRERRWYVAGTEGTLIADLVRNTLMWRRNLELGPPFRKQFQVSESDHNGADFAMARDLIAALEDEAEFPVSPFQAIEAGLTVMAIDKALALGQVVDCTAMWDTLDTAMKVA
ncbi:MAG: Gfo/Idh/MocA family oxidoreductase [Alphaproteobacteria bacterium]|nr:Gfo/Idh/MocA family oxidoreductase [Alphaproteobacteria bacterium]